jgi:uncharacterized membrane protein
LAEAKILRQRGAEGVSGHVQRKDWINIAGAAIAVGLVVNLAALTLAVIFVELKTANENILMFLAGGLLTQVTNIVQWFFGSSSENKKQAETISTLAATAQTAQAALTPSVDTTVIPVGANETVTVAGPVTNATESAP